MEPKVVIIFIFIFLSNCLVSEAQLTPLCDGGYRCTSDDDPTWASADNKQCVVFRNLCYLANENCRLQNQNKPLLHVLQKEKCQKLCLLKCPKNYKPVCGSYKGLKREFLNQCIMDYHICTTGITYFVYNDGPCEDTLALDY